MNADFVLYHRSIPSLLEPLIAPAPLIVTLNRGPRLNHSRAGVAMEVDHTISNLIRDQAPCDAVAV